jgi:hypothetical protein
MKECPPADAGAKPSNRRNEDQDYRNNERKQTEKFGSCEADEQTALLTVCCCRITQSALKKRTENVANTTSGEAGTNCCKTCTD